MTCNICCRGVEYPGSTQHFKKHRREFEEETGYSKYTNRNIIIAYYKPENASNWAVDIVESLREAGKIPKDANLSDFE